MFNFVSVLSGSQFCRRFHFPFAMIILLMLESGIQAMAQMAVNPERTGIVPYETYESTGIDNVDMSNGSLYIQAPFYSLPQKGSLSLSWTLLGSGGTSYSATPTCDQSGCEYSYSMNSSAGVGINLDQYASIAPVYPVLNVYNDDGVAFGYPYSGSALFESYPHKVIDGHGGSHYLGYDPATNFTTLRSADGSGYLEILTDSNGYKDGATGTLYDSKGIKITPDGITDPNGNQISWNSDASSITDSLGRQITWTAADVSLCPNLNDPTQAVVSAKTFTVPNSVDTATKTATFIFCTAEVHYHTNLIGNNGNEYIVPQGQGMSHSYEEATGYAFVIQSIVNPGGTTWTFKYDSAAPNDYTTIAYGDLTKITLPTGGVIEYQYVTKPTCTPQYGRLSDGRCATFWLCVSTVHSSDIQPNSHPTGWNTAGLELRLFPI